MEPIGTELRARREACHISLEELARVTRIPLRTLRALESDTHGELPSPVFVRGFLRSYAKAVGLDPTPVLERYRARSAAALPAPTPVTSITPPEGGRRYGMAIALVILLILFTLALSIVLRPRHRDVPLELSAAPAVAEPPVVSDASA